MTRIWMNGELVPGDDARVSVLAHTLHYGVGVFEGIRSYECTGGGASVFRLDDHLKRLAESARACGLELPYDRATLARACVDVLEDNGLLGGYLRPLAYQDEGKLTGLGASPPVHVAIAANPWGAYLGEEGLRRGIRVHISSYRRASHGGFLSKAKICGQYVMSTLAKRTAIAQGWDEALLSDDQGFICEGSGENLFVVRDGILITPPASAAILPGITRDTVMHLARHLDDSMGLIAIREENITRDQLVVADEVFLTGTAAEVTPVREVDGITIGAGEGGPITRALQDAYFALVRGESSAPEHWRTTFGALVR